MLNCGCTYGVLVSGTDSALVGGTDLSFDM